VSAIDNTVAARLGSINEVAAISLAAGSIQIQSFSQGGKLSFSSISETWQLDATTCQLTLRTVDVSFSISANGTRQQITAREDPSISEVYNVTNLGVTPTATNSPNWSGYSFNNGQPINNAYAIWSEPTAYLPSQGCQLTHCDVAFWVGLTNQVGGGNGIAQAGTDSGIYCVGGCSYFYYAWYEFFPYQSTLQKCSMSIGTGHQIFSQAYEYPKTSTTYYTVVEDETTGNICTSSYNMSSTGLSYYGQFVGERPSYPTGYARLPKFDTTTFTSGYVNGLAMFSFSYYTWTMVNGGTQNIRNNYVSSTSFSETWLSSSGT
jgi:hypothetical protein